MIAFPDGYRYHLLAEVNSTNMYAMEQVYAGLAVNGDVYFTEFQSQGKGQRGKSWHSGPGESILMSIILDSSPVPASQTFRISATVALAVKEFLENETGKAFSVKWPNDLYTGDRKAGGILIENVMKSGSLRWSIVGTGVNINQESFPEGLQNAFSLRMLTGETYDAIELSKRLAGYIDAGWKQLLQGQWPQILGKYNESLYGRGQVKKLRKGPVVIPCKIQRVDDNGMLVCGENDEWHFRHGEVEWVIG
jgi:BirA family biotin operon repressor/biotin-[acetyl-CoA-carboxylase] ligase